VLECLLWVVCLVGHEAISHAGLHETLGRTEDDHPMGLEKELGHTAGVAVLHGHHVAVD
jgi:hypothetical protein